MASLNGRRSLVTGGAGLIGSHLVDCLVSAGSHVTVLDNLDRGRLDNIEQAIASGKVEFVQGDICDRALVGDLVAQSDFVFHQAALRITQCAAEPRRAFDVMYAGAFNVVEAAANSKVTKLVAASSASVYGLASRFPTGEQHHPYDNRTLYGAAKLALEGMLRAFHDTHRLSFVALRYFNVYGPRMDIHGKYTEVLARWIARVEAGEPLLVFGDPHQTMDMVYVEDVARANVLAAESDERSGVFNIGSGVEVSLEGLARCLLARMRADLPIRLEPARAVNPVPRRLADISAANKRLGFTPSTSLEEGLDRLLDWKKSQAPDRLAVV